MCVNKRCVNIDWLELYCKESFDLYPCNADFFRNHGYFVRERDYGTRQYNEMFTLLDKDDRPFLEIRRNPVSANKSDKSVGIFDPKSCHIRLANRYCYADNAIQLVSDFLMKFDYTIVRLFRLDLCLDFEKFDKGDDPKDVLLRYLKGKYTKINQGNLSAHGKDRWNVRDWNSISWGAPTSMVSTKMYNKTLELEEAKDKPYIRYAWQQAGLVDDFANLTKRNPDGSIYKPQIWRVEFSIRSSARGWFLCEDCTGNKTKTLYKEHTLATYATKDDQLKAFIYLQHHYFHFKIYREGVRKDRCEDKVLFDFGHQKEVYTLDRLLTDKPKDTSYEALAKRLRNYRIVHPDNDIRNACDVLLRSLESMKVRDALPNFYDHNEAKLLQAIIAHRMQTKDSLEDSKEIVTAYFRLSSEIW